MLCADTLEQCQAVDTRHVVVADDTVELGVGEFRERLAGTGRRRDIDGPVEPLEIRADERRETGFVVDTQHRERLQ